MNVYDFDDTIYDGESALDFFFYYLKKTPYLVRYIPKVLYAMYKYKRGRVTVEQALEIYAPFIERYFRNIDDFEADAAVGVLAPEVPRLAAIGQGTLPTL